MLSHRKLKHIENLRSAPILKKENALIWTTTAGSGTQTI